MWLGNRLRPWVVLLGCVLAGQAALWLVLFPLWLVLRSRLGPQVVSYLVFSVVSIVVSVIIGATVSARLFRLRRRVPIRYHPDGVPIGLKPGDPVDAAQFDAIWHYTQEHGTSLGSLAPGESRTFRIRTDTDNQTE